VVERIRAQGEFHHPAEDNLQITSFIELYRVHRISLHIYN